MEILKKFSIKTDNTNIYDTAFSHSSYCNENNIDRDYQRLEFLGDKVLDLIMSEYLYHTTRFEEGKMTKIRSMYVCENALYEYAIRMGIDKEAKLGRGEAMNNTNNHKAIYADMVESFLGAVYLDQGFLKAKEIVYDVVVPFIETKPEVFFVDYKSELQELVQTDRKSVEYELVSEEGPAHDKIFTTNAVVEGVIYGTGSAKTKKEAEQLAAKDALEKRAN